MLLQNDLYLTNLHLLHTTVFPHNLQIPSLKEKRKEKEALIRKIARKDLDGRSHLQTFPEKR